MSRWARNSSMAPLVAPTRLLLFTAARLPWGVPLEEMAGVVEERGVLPLPMAHPALWGVMPVDGAPGCSPVIDMGAVVPGLPRFVAPVGTTRVVALFPHESGSVGIRVEDLAGLAPSVDRVDDRDADEHLARVPDRLRNWATGVVLAAGTPTLLFSRDAFLQWVTAEGAPARRRP